MKRRTFCTILAGTVVGSAGCTSRSALSETSLATLLDLTPAEAAWLDVLSNNEREELRERLADAALRASPRTVQLLLKVLDRRDRLFAYVGYPPSVATGLCDGLLEE